MKVLLCLMALVGVALAGGCNNLQRLKVKQQWGSMFDGSSSRQAEGNAVFRSMFAIDDTTKGYFKRVHVDDQKSPEFQAHIGRVMSGLDMAISLLDDEDILNAQLTHLNAQHKERKISSGAFLTFKKALGQVAPAALGRCFDKAAWSACYDVISHGITK